MYIRQYIEQYKRQYMVGQYMVGQYMVGQYMVGQYMVGQYTDTTLPPSFSSSDSLILGDVNVMVHVVFSSASIDTTRAASSTQIFTSNFSSPQDYTTEG